MNRPESRFSWDGDQVLVFGVLNLTPDSFSDGGVHPDAESALSHARRMMEEGADLIDVGGESTRPRGSVYGDGYRTLSADEEIDRIAPVVSRLRAQGIPFAIDTTKAEVARFALERGAKVVNDTSNGRDPALLAAAAENGAGLVLMHNRGRGEVDGEGAGYADVTSEVIDELSDATERALEAGVPAASIAWDPGLGFAKTAEESMRILGMLPRIVEIGYPVYVGASRKSFLAAFAARAGARPGPDRRLGASVAACLVAADAGARAVRVHDVHDSVQALAIRAAVGRAR